MEGEEVDAGVSEVVESEWSGGGGGGGRDIVGGAEKRFYHERDEEVGDFGFQLLFDCRV